MGPGVVLVGGAALLLLAKSMGQKSPVPPTQTGMNTNSVQPVNPSVDPGKVIGAVAGTVASVVGTIISSIGTTGGTVAAATGSGAAVVAETAGLAVGFTSYGTAAVFGVILAIIIINAIGTSIGQQESRKHYAEQNASFAGPVDLAKQFFNSLTANVTSRDDYGRNPQLNMSPAVVREVALTCLYVASQVWQARNDALVRYYTYLGWTPAQMGTAPYASAVPGLIFTDVDATTPYFSNKSLIRSDSLVPLVSGDLTGALRFPFSIDMSPAGRANWNAMTRPFASSELAAAAGRVLGEKAAGVLARVRFGGLSTALLLAIIEGYGGVHTGTWNNWPGDQKFTETLANIFGMQAVNGTFYVTNAGQPNAMNSWWLVDPATGYRVETIVSHNDNTLRVSVPGTPIYPGLPAYDPRSAQVAGYGRFAGGRFGFHQDECIDPVTGNIVGCDSDIYAATGLTRLAQRAATANIANATVKPNVSAVQAQGGGVSLPLLAIAAGAGLLLLKGGAAGFGSYTPRRRIRRRRR